MSGMPERKTLSVTFSCPMCTEKADRIADLEQKLVWAQSAETVEKAAFVDEMCKALGVTFEALVNDDSVKAGIKEKDDA